jgi:putative transposase
MELCHSDHSIVYSCLYHLVFCSNFRRNVLNGAVAERMHDLVVEKHTNYGYVVWEIAVQADHVHLRLDIDPRVGVSAFVGNIKGSTSYIVRDNFPWLKKRLPTLFTHSKFIPTIGGVTLDVVQEYIANQRGV